MKPYRIIAKQTTYYVAYVPAEDFDEAREIAEYLTYDDFKELPEILWEVETIERGD